MVQENNIGKIHNIVFIHSTDIRVAGLVGTTIMLQTRGCASTLKRAMKMDC